MAKTTVAPNWIGQLGADLSARVANLRVEETLARVRAAGDAATAELEFEVLLTRLDAINEAAGECLAAIRDHTS